MNGKAMNGMRFHRVMTTCVLAFALGLVSCATPPAPSRVDSVDEPRRAARVVQEREQELARLRADMAAIMVAGAKKEAELHELRALVTQLRLESAESRQAAIEADRAAEVRHTALAILTVERDQLAVVHAQPEKSDQHLAALQETVTTLSQDLAQMKQAMARSIASAAVHEINANERKGSEIKPTRQMTERRASSSHIVPAVRIALEDAGDPTPSRVTVQPGDSLWILARRHHTTIQALRAANGLQGDQLLVGQELTLP